MLFLAVNQVRLVDKGQSIAAVARTLGVVDQTLSNWVKAHKQGSSQEPTASR
jgi:transposase-like protein